MYLLYKKPQWQHWGFFLPKIQTFLDNDY
jgi:hypothetical protein